MPTGAARFMQPLDVTPLGQLRSTSTDPLPEARWRFHSLSLRDLPVGAVAPRFVAQEARPRPLLA